LFIFNDRVSGGRGEVVASLVVRASLRRKVSRWIAPRIWSKVWRRISMLRGRNSPAVGRTWIHFTVIFILGSESDTNNRITIGIPEIQIEKLHMKFRNTKFYSFS
jgi:hypothetical protein